MAVISDYLSKRFFFFFLRTMASKALRVFVDIASNKNKTCKNYLPSQYFVDGPEKGRGDWKSMIIKSSNAFSNTCISLAKQFR